MRQLIKRALAFSVVGSTLLIATSAGADDFRANFPPLYTTTPLGVNIQTGRFQYWLYTFEMGPFAVQRGFGKSGFPFLGRLYWHTVQTATGAGQPEVTVALGGGFTETNAPGTQPKALVGGYGAELLLDFYLDSQNNNYIWWSSSSAGYRLIHVAGGYTLTDHSGNTYFFADNGGNYPNPDGLLTKVTYADGSTISIQYDAQQRLRFMTSSRGYAVLFEYGGSGVQSKICGFNLAQTYATSASSCSASTYTVSMAMTQLTSGAYQINSVTDVMGGVSTATYTANNQLACVTLPNSSTCEFTNTYGTLPGELAIYKPDQVRIQVDANGNNYNYDYDFPSKQLNGDDPPQYPGGPPILSSGWVNGPGFSAQGNYENGLLKTLSAPGGGPVAFDYDGINLKKATYAEGNSITITRDWVGNALTVVEAPKPGSSEPSLTRIQTFPTANLYGNPSICQAASDKLCDKPITQVDAKGNQTDYTYDPAHGGVLTKTLPAVQVNASGATIRPQVRYEYAQRYAWIKNAGGTYSQASTPIWVLTRERTCRTTAASGQTCAGGAADEVITDYDYGPDSGPNNLLLRGVAVTADGQTLRTCYRYDANGRKISQTQPKAGLAVCP